MRGFLLILCAGLGCAVLGGILGWLLGVFSPEFIALVAQPQPVVEPARLGAALGAVSGLLMGSLAMVAGLLVGVLRAWLTRGHPQTTQEHASSSSESSALAGRLAEEAHRYYEKRTR